MLLLVSTSLTYSQSQADSLKIIWENENQLDSIRFNALDEYYEINNQIKPDSTLTSLNYHFELANEKNATLQLYRATKRKGNIHRLKGNYDIAMEAYTEAESLAKRLNDAILQAKIMGNMGNVFIYRQDYKQATEHFSKALKLYQELNNSDGESHMLTSLGSVFLILNNYDLALEYYEKSLSTLNKRGFEDRSTAIIFINMGWTNFEKELYQDAKTYYEKGLKILQVKNEKFFIADCYSVLASIHLKLNQLEKANDYANKNLALNKELDIKSGIINAEITIAKIYFESKDTSNFNEKWADKLLNDMKEKGIANGIIVASHTCLPADIDKYTSYVERHGNSITIIPMEFKIIHVVVNRIRSILILKARENNDHEIPEIMKKCWANLNSPNFQLPIKSMISEIRTMEKIFKQERTAFERSSANKEKTINGVKTNLVKIVTSFTRSVGDIFPDDLLEHKDDQFIE